VNRTVKKCIIFKNSILKDLHSGLQKSVFVAAGCRQNSHNIKSKMILLPNA